MNQPTVSVIVPVFNAERYIDRCVRNLKDCRTRGISMEVIFVDDCSTDRTPQMLVDRTDHLDFATVARSAFNGGPGLARNIGLELASGDYVTFLDVDDEYIAGAFEQLVDFAAGRRPDMIAFNGEVRSLAGHTGQRRDLQQAISDREQRIRSFLRAEMDGSVIFTMFRRSFLADHFIHFPPGLHEDIPVLFKCYYYANTILPFHDPVYRKHAEPSSIVHTVSKRHIDGTINAYAAVVLFLQSKGVDRQSFDDHVQYGMRGFVSDLVLKIRDYETDVGRRHALYSYLLAALDKVDWLISKTFQPQTNKDKVAAEFFASFPPLPPLRPENLMAMERSFVI